jgi:Spy/CpxP family protein refolding chaperone
MTMKIMITALALFGILASGCGPVPGGGACMFPGHHGPGMPEEMCAKHEAFREELGLTEKQKQEFLELAAARLDEIRALHDSIPEKADALKEALFAETVDKEAVRAAVSGLGALVADGSVLMAGAIQECRDREILTPEQQALLEETREKLRSRFEKNRKGRRPFGRHGHEDCDGRGPGKKIMDELDITWAQKTDLMEVFFENRTDIEYHRDTVRDSAHALRDAVTAVNAAEEDIRQRALELEETAADALVFAADIIADIRGVLTDEQIETLKTHHSERKEHRRRRGEMMFELFIERVEAAAE